MTLQLGGISGEQLRQDFEVCPHPQWAFGDAGDDDDGDYDGDGDGDGDYDGDGGGGDDDDDDDRQHLAPSGPLVIKRLLNGGA